MRGVHPCGYSGEGVLGGETLLGFAYEAELAALDYEYRDPRSENAEYQLWRSPMVDTVLDEQMMTGWNFEAEV